MRVLIFDTEATGLSDGQICQLSYIIADSSKSGTPESLWGKNMYFTVDEMSEGAQQVHGLSLEQLQELSHGERFEDRADEIWDDFCSVSTWIGHNVSADDRYIRLEMSRLGRTFPRIKTFCTMNYFTGTMNLKRKVNIGRPKPPRLEELVEFYGIAPEEVVELCASVFEGGEQAHDARYDTAATYLALKRATEHGDVRGIL